MHGAAMEARTVAKKKAGRPKGENNRGEGKLVRIDPDVYGKAQVVSLRRNLKLGEYLSGLLSGAVDRDYGKVLREMEGSGV